MLQVALNPDTTVTPGGADDTEASETPWHGGTPGHEKEGLNAFMGALAVLSTIVGGGIVGIPFSLYNLGIPVGAFTMVLVASACHYSCALYMAARDEIPVPVNSIYQLAYITMGRQAIYLVSVIQFIAAFGLDIIYFIVFGDTSASLIKTLFYTSHTDNFLTSRACYVLILACAMVLPLLQRELKEISILSVILFGGIALFLVLMVVELTENGSNLNPD